MASSKDFVNVKILFVEGVLDDHVKLMTGMTAYCIALPNKITQINCKGLNVRRHWAQKHTNRPLGQWQHDIFCDESRFMLFRIDNRIRVRRLVGEAMNRDLHMVMWLTEAVLHMYGVVSLIWEKPPCAFWIRCHWSHLSPSSGGTLGYTWQGMVSQRLNTG